MKEKVRERERERERERAKASHPICCGLAGGMRGE